MAKSKIKGWRRMLYPPWHCGVDMCSLESTEGLGLINHTHTGLELGGLWPTSLMLVLEKEAMRLLQKMSKQEMNRTYLVVQWLRLQATKSGGPGLILGQEARFHMLQQRSKTPPTKTNK